MKMLAQTASKEVLTIMPSFTDVATVMVLLLGIGLGAGFLWWIADHFLKKP